jgi:hypothetical protein
MLELQNTCGVSRRSPKLSGNGPCHSFGSAVLTTDIHVAELINQSQDALTKTFTEN